MKGGPPGSGVRKSGAVVSAGEVAASIRDGATLKFVHKVYRNLFSGIQALRFGKEVLNVTERAVFRLTRGKLVLEEVAPGVDVDKDVLTRMEFRPSIDQGVKEMDRRIFRKGSMRLKQEIPQP